VALVDVQAMTLDLNDDEAHRLEALTLTNLGRGRAGGGQHPEPHHEVGGLRVEPALSRRGLTNDATMQRWTAAIVAPETSRADAAQIRPSLNTAGRAQNGVHTTQSPLC
jgi:hypothetical protein